MKKNVIVVMLDTLQFNYLGCYGNTWIKTPNLDRFARQGVLFENAYTEGLPTVPCRRAMLTGRYTLPVKGWSQLDVDDTTIADLCWGHPIDSALIHDSGPFRLPKFGYSRGFDKVHFIHGHETDHQYYAQDELIALKAEDYYEDHVMEKADAILGENVMRPLMNQVECHLKERQYWKSDEDQHVAQVMKSASRYIEEVDRNKSFFLWVDSFDPHEPWDPPSVYDPNLKCMYDPDYTGKDMFLPIQGHVNGLYTEEELHHIRMLYAEKVTNVDKWFGWLMDRVRALGLEENTLVMVVSDHGSPMGNGEHGHGIMRKCRPWPYEELAHIPFLMRGPGLPKGKRLKGFVQSCDVAPTVVDWLGIGVHPSMQGRTLLPLARGRGRQRPRLRHRRVLPLLLVHRHRRLVVHPLAQGRREDGRGLALRHLRPGPRPVDRPPAPAEKGQRSGGPRHRLLQPGLRGAKEGRHPRRGRPVDLHRCELGRGA